MIMCYYYDISDKKLKIWKNGEKLGKVLPKKKKKDNFQSSAYTRAKNS